MRASSPLVRRLSALVLGAAVLSACGGSSGSGGGEAKEAAGPSPVAVVKAASANATGEGSSKLSLVSTTTIGSQDVAFSGEGAFDYTDKTGRLSFSVPGADGAATGGGTIEQRIVGDDLYLSLPQQDGVFYKIKVADAAGTSLGASTDPTASLQALQAAGDVEEVGQVEVRGTEATHYRGSYGVAEALEKATGVGKAVLENSLRGAKIETVPFDAYVDAEGRLVKLVTKIELPGSASTGGQPLTSQATIELYDFGAPVTVEAPPAASVRDGGPLLAALKRASPQASGAPSTVPASPAPSPVASVTG